MSESTITQEEEVMGRELSYEICIPCVEQWCMLWFSAPTHLNQTLENQGIETAKNHEAVNMAIAYAISRPFGGAHTPRSCMLTTVAGFLYKTPNRSWDMNKSLGGWEMGGRLEILPCVDDDVDECSE